MSLRVSIAGVLVGVALSALAVALEVAGPELGTFALHGSGALVVPGIGVPLALYGGWTWLALRAGRPLPVPMTLYVVALDAGMSALGPFEALAHDEPIDASAFVAGLLSGALFIVPTALLGAIVYLLFATGRWPARPWPLAIAFLAGLPLGPLVPLIPMGLVTGAGVAAATRARTGAKILALGALVAVALLSPFALVLASSPAAGR